MSTLDRRLERLEKLQPKPFAGEIWCCATEADAQVVIDRLRAKDAPPPLLFIAGKADESGAVIWRREGKTVQDLFRAVDGYCSNMDAGPQLAVKPDPLIAQLSDEELLEVITDDGFTLVLYHDGRARLLDAMEVFVAPDGSMSHEERLKWLN